MYADPPIDVLARLAAGDFRGLGDRHDPKRLTLPSPAAASCLGVRTSGLVIDADDAGVANGEGRANKLGVVYMHQHQAGKGGMISSPSLCTKGEEGRAEKERIKQLRGDVGIKR